MLRPASGFLVPWHSKQYFWKVRRAERGGWRAQRVLGAAGRRPAGAWADSSDASATTQATHNPERVMELPAGGAENEVIGL